MENFLLWWRPALALAWLLLGLVLAALSVLHWHIFSAIGYILSGVLAAGIALFGVSILLESFFAAALAVVIFVVGLCAVYTETYGLKADRQLALIELSEVFADILMAESAYRLTPEEGKLVQQGLQTCLLQGQIDIANSVVALQQLELGPRASLGAGVLSEAGDQNKSPECLDFYAELRAKHPEPFRSFDNSHPALVPKANSD
jgi:hypothetical protein